MDGFIGEYFFCTPNGASVDLNNLRDRVWTPALQNAAVQYHEMKQTRHTFATLALSCGENPLWIAKVMGHRNTEMIIKVYGIFVANALGSDDGKLLNAALLGMVTRGNNEENQFWARFGQKSEKGYGAGTVTP